MHKQPSNLVGIPSRKGKPFYNLFFACVCGSYVNKDTRYRFEHSPCEITHVKIYTRPKLQLTSQSLIENG